MRDILAKIEARGGVINSGIIQDVLEAKSGADIRTKQLYNRYKTTQVPIFDREFEANESANKINNKINNDFFSEIVDTKVGYMFGNPISYQLDKVDNRAKQEISDFNIRNNVEDTDSETGKMSTICGVSYRLLYIDSDGKERILKIPAWEGALIYENDVNEPVYGMRYYMVTDFKTEDGRDIETSEGERRLKVEWYDDEFVTFYKEISGEFVLDPDEEVNPQRHMFGGVPLIAFPNNEEWQGDCEKVLELIDAYDRTISDINSELESFRLAYMAFYGCEPDEETIAMARQTGAFGIAAANEGTKIEFITKQLNDVAVENHLNRLEMNILRFAKSVNFTDKEFANNSSGVSLKYKLMALNNKVSTATRKFTTGLRRQFKLLANSWAVKGIKLNYLDIFFSFKPNLPVDIDNEADATSKLKGLVSEKTRLGLLTFVDDVDFEIREMEKDNEANIDLNNFMSNDSEDNTDEGEDGESIAR